MESAERFVLRLLLPLLPLLPLLLLAPVAVTVVAVAAAAAVGVTASASSLDNLLVLVALSAATIASRAQRFASISKTTPLIASSRAASSVIWTTFLTPNFWHTLLIGGRTFSRLAISGYVMRPVLINITEKE
jgi:hypothetical protein